MIYGLTILIKSSDNFNHSRVPSEAEERKKLGTDPMFKLQYKNKDEQVVMDAEPLLDILQVRS